MDIDITRNASLTDLAKMLEDQGSRKHDIVTPACNVKAVNGDLVVKGAEVEMTVDGVTSVDGTYRPTDIGDQGISDKLGIPTPYLARMRREAIDLYDHNVNGWLGRSGKSYLLRTFSDGAGGVGIARALLSPNYRIVDNIDVLYAVLAGIRDSGMICDFSCDLTERRMVARVTSAEVHALAPDLLKGYRSPFTGATGADNPTVFAGFVVSNSETGGGAFSITPRITVQVCDNGMTITKDALREVHLGSKMDDGVVRWASDTKDAALALVTKQARDAVKTFMDVEYVRKAIADIERTAGRPIEDSAATIKVVSTKLRYTESIQKDLLNHFIRGGDTTAGGILHAVTSVAQTIDNPDLAWDLERSAIRAMELAAATG